MSRWARGNLYRLRRRPILPPTKRSAPPPAKPAPVRPRVVLADTVVFSLPNWGGSVGVPAICEGVTSGVILGVTPGKSDDDEDGCGVGVAALNAHMRGRMGRRT